MQALSAVVTAQALEGLRVILGVRPQSLNAMIPKLMKPPLTPTGLKAVGALAEVSGTTWTPQKGLNACCPPGLSQLGLKIAIGPLT